MPDLDIANLFATDETTTVFLFPKSDAHPSGVWVEFKKQLTYGEQCDVESALFTGLSTQERVAAAQEAEQRGGSRSTILVDTGRQAKLRLAMWIVDWNLPDRNGKTVRWPAHLQDRIAIIGNLGERAGAWLAEQIQRIEGEAAEVAQADPEVEASGPLSLERGDRRRAAVSS
jgi:hypothetical protein